MFDEKEQQTGLGGVTVQDAWVGLQLLSKAASKGVIQDNEFEVLGNWRNNLTDAIKRAVGKDFDEELARLQAMQIEAMRQQQAAAQTEAAPENDVNEEVAADGE